MPYKIKFNFLNILFRCFSFLADKTNGWRVFVKPKLILGTLLVGVMASCNIKSKLNKNNSLLNDSIVVTNQLIETSLDSAVIHPTIDTTQQKIPVPVEISKNSDYHDDEIEIVEIIDESVICYVPAIKKPEFPGGNEALSNYLKESINYPSIAKENGIQGRVLCQFVVSEDGSIQEVKVIRSTNPILDKEAVRVIESMPKWIPAKEHGRYINTTQILPVTFKLD